MSDEQFLHADDLAGRVAFITGAASGIGAAAARAVAGEGVSVLCLDLADAGPVAEEIVSAGGRALAVAGDVTDEQAVQAAVSVCRSELGPIDIVLCSAGILHLGGLEEASEADLRRVLEVNLLGPMLVLKHTLGEMRGRRGASVILVGSLAGTTGGVLSGPAYGASKGGVHALVKWAAKAYAGDGVRVNGLAPGPVSTPMTEGKGYGAEGIPLGRLGRPTDMTPAILYLASGASSWVTGQTLHVNGGLYAS